MRRVPRDHRGDPALTLRLVTYNVLADSYVSPEYCPFTPLECLEPRGRRARLLERLASLDADVLCLQELEPAVYQEVRAKLPAWEPRYARKGEDKPDGCGIFVRRSAATVIRSEAMYFRDRPWPNGPDSGHLALLVSMIVGTDELSVATTHFKWQPLDAPPEASWGLREARELADVVLSRGGSWVVCGDLNTLPGSETMAVLRAVGLVDPLASPAGGFTCNSNKRAKRIDYVLCSADLTAVPVEGPAIDDLTPLPSWDEPSDHLPVIVEITPATRTP